VSRVLYADVIGGAAGDMLLAALIDAGAPTVAIQAAVDSVLPGRFRIETEDVRRGGLRARLLRLSGGTQGDSRSVLDLLTAVESAELPGRIGARALAVLKRLGEAESRVHGIDPSALHLHELGDDDTLLDVVGVAAALEALGVDRMLVSSIPLSTGEALVGRHAHGEVPLPATVTLELLKGFDARGAGTGETITPTAAAIFAGLGAPAKVFPSMTIEGVGYGAGTRETGGMPNVVRVILGTERSAGLEGRDLMVLEANLDDLTPELVADAERSLLAAGALDVWTAPIHMKKGRLGFLLSALCEPEVESHLLRTFFEATSTFGVRTYSVRRAELERTIVSVQVWEGVVRVKVGFLDGRVMSATPEHDDVARLAGELGRSVRQVYDEAAAAALSLHYAASGDSTQ
jgi:uncharacterized protein (TIGR00299 family) protein